jgi:hypothetical protein
MNTGIPSFNSSGGGVGGMGQIGMTGSPMQQNISPDKMLQIIVEYIRRMGLA